MDDTQLLLEYVEKGSEPAFTRLVERHVDLVYSAALRRVGGDTHRAREVTQMVFADFARKAAKLTKHPLLAGWLHQSTRWAAAGLRRTELRRLANETAAAIEHNEFPEEQAADWTKMAPLLDEALDTLSGSDREAVLLRFFSDQPFAAIGTRLGLTENAARMRVERALDKLRALLAKRGATSTAAALSLALSRNAIAAAPGGLANIVAVSVMNGTAAAVTATVGNLIMAKLQLWLIGLLIAGLIVGLAVQHSRTKQIEEQIVALSERRAARKTSFAALEKKHHERQATLRTLEADAVKLPALPPLTPEQRERVRLDMLIRKGELDQTYPALFRHLKLSAAELDTFKGLLVERNQAVYDANKLARDLGLTLATKAEMKAVRDSGLAEIDQRIAALLGPENFDYFKIFDDTLPYRQELFRFMARTFTSDNDIMLDRLTAIYAQTCPTRFDSSLNPDNWFDTFPDVFLQAAAELITPQQRQQLEQLAQDNAAVRRMIEISIAAAEQGRLKLTGKSARDYPASATSQ